MSFLSRYLQNVSALLIGQIIAFIFGIVQLIYLARVLGPSGLGTMNFALVLVSYVTITAGLGLPIYGTRVIARKKALSPSLFWNATIIRLGAALLLIILCTLGLIFFKPSDADVWVQILFLLTVFPTLLLPDWVYNGLERMTMNSLVKVITAGTTCIAILILVQKPDDLILVPLIQGVSIIIGLLFAYIPLRKEIFFSPVSIRPDKWFSCITSSQHIWVTNILGLLLTSLDVLIIELLLTTTDLGYYTASSRIIASFTTLLGLVLIGIFPALCRTLGKGTVIFSRYFGVLIIWICVFEVLACMLLSWNAHLIVDLLYKDQYLMSVVVWQILIWSIIPITINSIYSWSMWAADRDAAYVKVLILNICTTAPLIIVGISVAGIAGAAGGIVLSHLIAGVYYLYPLRRLLPFPYKKSAVIIAIGAFGCLTVLFLETYTHLPIFFAQLSAVVIYLTLILGGKVITFSEIRQIMRIFKGKESVCFPPQEEMQR